LLFPLNLSLNCSLSAHSPNYGNVSSNLPCPSFSKRGSPPFAKGRSGGIFVAEFMNRST
jgi:hypothetical protein